MTDNKKLAAAVVALYGVTAAAPDAEWTDEDEAIQQAAFNCTKQRTVMQRPLRSTCWKPGAATSY